MSDPVTNAEIEDVLSAVRRLVSETGTSKRADAAADTDRSKLVLTPAFRVEPDADTETAHEPDQVETESVKMPVQEQKPEGPKAVSEKSPEDDPAMASVEPVTFELEDTAFEASVEEMVQGAVRDHEAEPTPDTTDDGTDADKENVADAAPEPPHNAPPKPEPGSLAARIAELEAVVIAAPDASYEPDGSEEPDIPDEIIFHRTGPRPVAPAAEPFGSSEPVSDDTGTDDAAAEASLPDPELTRVEAADIDDWQDVSDSDLDEAGYEPAGETVVEDTTFSRHDDTPEDAAADPFGEDRAEDDEMVIDEAMLREIVARLVREELQGTMGEHITRNLRRMVRREIARALALQSFD